MSIRYIAEEQQTPSVPRRSFLDSIRQDIQDIKDLEEYFKNKDKPKDGDKKKPRSWTNEQVLCLTCLFMASSPWVGLKVLQTWAVLMGQYHEVFQQLTK